jgi:hypothetical protein
VASAAALLDVLTQSLRHAAGSLPGDPRPFLRTGQAVGIFPGCDGRFETCESKFNNRENFGGHPFVPAANPSLVKLSSAINGGKK